MSNKPRIHTENSHLKEADESGRALLLNDSPLGPSTSNLHSPEALLGSPTPLIQPSRSPISSVRLPPINSSSSSPQVLSLKKGLEKKAGLASISSSPIRPSALFEEQNLRALNRYVNWEKLRAHVFAHKLTGMFNVLLDEKHKDIEKGKTVEEHEVIVYRTPWVRFKTYYIDPESWFIVIWRFVFELATMFFVFVYSYRLAFRTDMDIWNPVSIIGTIIDCFFGVTIILNFFIALRKSDGTLITNKEVIVTNYIKSYFLFDLITLIPFEQFLVEMAFIRLFRVVHLGTFFKHVNEFMDLIVPYFVEGLAIIKISDFLGSLTTVTLVLMLVFHFSACIWVALGFMREPDEKTWFDNIAGYYDKDVGMLVGGDFKVYICSLVQVAQTFTTVGYGNYYGYSLREHLFSLVLLFLGFLLFVLSFEKVKSIIGSFTEEERRENEEVEELEVWLKMIERLMFNHKDVINVALIKEIQAILNYRIQYDWQELFIDNEQFKKLDHKSSEQVLDFGLQKFKQKFHILFQEISDPLIHLTVIQSDSRLYLPGEEIVQKGKHCKGIFLILRGTILLAGPSKEDYFTRLGSGSFFGEISLTKERKSPMYYIAETEVNCLFIKKEIFEEVAGKFPKDMEKLKALAYFRYKHFLYQKHQYQISQAAVAKDPKPASAEFDLPENQPRRKEEGSPEESEGLTLDDRNLPKKTFREDPIPDSPERFREQSDHDDEKKFKIDEAEVRHYNKISRKAEKQAKRLEKLLSLEEGDIELVENSTDSDEDNEGEEIEDDTEEEETEGDDDDSTADANDELNSSDIYPVEMKAGYSDDEEEEAEKDINYLEERIMFMHSKLDRIKKKYHEEVQNAIKKQRYCFKRLLKTETLKPFLTKKHEPVNLMNQ